MVDSGGIFSLRDSKSQIRMKSCRKNEIFIESSDRKNLQTFQAILKEYSKNNSFKIENSEIIIKSRVLEILKNVSNDLLDISTLFGRRSKISYTGDLFISGKKILYKVDEQKFKNNFEKIIELLDLEFEVDIEVVDRESEQKISSISIEKFSSFAQFEDIEVGMPDELGDGRVVILKNIVLKSEEEDFFSPPTGMDKSEKIKKLFVGVIDYPIELKTKIIFPTISNKFYIFKIGNIPRIITPSDIPKVLDDIKERCPKVEAALRTLDPEFDLTFQVQSSKTVNIDQLVAGHYIIKRIKVLSDN